LLFVILIYLDFISDTILRGNYLQILKEGAWQFPGSAPNIIIWCFYGWVDYLNILSHLLIHITMSYKVDVPL